MTEPATDNVNRIVIVGGGSAGWITAGLLASEFHEVTDVVVTLVESPDVKTIGVGEGTWPTMRTTLQKIGLSETEFLIECSGAFKQGTKFVGWVTGTDQDVYYHPFSAPAGYLDLNLVPYWQEHMADSSFVDAVSVQGQLCDRNLAPKQAQTPEFAHVANYAYHLDAGKFADLLKRHCTERLGVRHVVDHVATIKGLPDGDIEGVRTAESGDIDGDLFVDCTGMAALLLGKHYEIPFVDRRHVLFNDAAIAAQVPYADDASPIASQTISTAQDSGWIWDIGLTTRRGIGYTYSSAHASDGEAERVVRRYIANVNGDSAQDIDLRKIEFSPGHRAKFWHRNCVAVGMSAGFIEPLEASALVLVELAGRMISEELPANRDVMDIVANRYNEKFLYRWDRIIDFLKLHYILSQRDDSQYWTDNRQSSGIPDSLQSLLQLWKYHVPGRQDLSQAEEIFSAASYQYVLCGMGYAPQGRRNARKSAEAAQLFARNASQTKKLVTNLPDNRELLAAIKQQGLPAAAMR